MHNINALQLRSYLILLIFSYSSRRIQETGNPRLIPRISPIASSLRSLGPGQGGRTHDRIHATLKFAAGYGSQFPVTCVREIKASVNKVYFAVIELSLWFTLRSVDMSTRLLHIYGKHAVKKVNILETI